LKTDTLQKKGAIVIIQWTTSIDLSGQLIYGIGRDISEIRGVQQNLLNSERLLNDAQKIAKIGSWEFDIVNKKCFQQNYILFMKLKEF
jgi:hypothetical protein